jgi:hypothetical protein
LGIPALAKYSWNGVLWGFFAELVIALGEKRRLIKRKCFYDNMRGREGERQRDRVGRTVSDTHTYNCFMNILISETQYVPNGDLATIIFNSSHFFPYLISGLCFMVAILVAELAFPHTHLILLLVIT